MNAMDFLTAVQETVTDNIETPAIPSEWDYWPFGPGYGESILPSLAKLGFSAAILFLIIIYLRFLFGPNGKFRDTELDLEAEELRREELADLDARLENGEIDQFRYDKEKKRI